MGKGNHYAQQARSKPVPICPLCGMKAIETETRFGLRNSCCGLWSWDRFPLVDAATHAARNIAHKSFDALWKSKRMTRSAAYAELAARLSIGVDDCHIKFMDAATASRVPLAVAEIEKAVL